MHRPFVSLLFGFVLAATPGPAMAGNEPTFDMADAERKLELAKKAEKEDKIPLACQFYEESFDHAPDKSSPFAMNVEYDLVQCWVQIGRYRDAYLQALELVKKVPDEESSVGLKKRILEIKQEAPCIKLDVPDRLQKIGALKVFIDGVAVPPDYWAPAYCWPLNVGEHEVTATATGKTWKNQPIRTSAPRRQYVVTLANPEPAPPPPAPPPEQGSPVNGKPAVGVGVGLIALGGILWVSGQVADNLSQNERLNLNVAAATFVGLGGGIFATGLGIYVAAPPSSPKTQKGVTMNLGVGFVGHF